MRKERTAPPIRLPKQVTPDDLIPRSRPQASLDDHLEIMTQAIFQAGLSWSLVAERWPAFFSAFDSFSTVLVAQYGESDIERLMETEGIFHSKRKIAATIDNARMLRSVVDRFGSLSGYISSFATYAELFGDARKRFAYLGDVTCYYWLFRTRHRVPVFESWMSRQAKDHPRMREMVLMGRAEATSLEDPQY